MSGSAATGSVAIAFEGGNTYTPGQRKRVTITITDTGGGRGAFGFQASARPVSNLDNGQAGSFEPGSGQFVQCEDGRERPASRCPANTALEFIQHNFPNPAGTFTFDWTAPETDIGEVRFFAAGNAANGNGNNNGDRIYTTSATITTGSRPTISQGGVGDAFNFGAGTAPSTWTAIFGTNLASGTAEWTSTGFPNNQLPFELDGVSATIGGKPAAVYSISPQQVNILAPSDVPIGNGVPVVLRNAAGESTPLSISISDYKPAFYAPFAQNGRLYVTAVALDGSLVGKVGVDPRVTRALRPGELVLIYGTGFGATSPVVPTDRASFPAAPMTGTASIRFGETAAVIDTGTGYLTGPGLYQFNVFVPEIADGDVPLTAEIGGMRSAANVYVAIQR